MQRKLRTKRGRAIYRQRGASVEPVFGQMKDRQGAGRFSMRGLVACRGEWHLHAAVHNLRKLRRESVRRATPTTPRRRSGHRTRQRPPEPRQGRLPALLNRFKRQRPAIQQQAPQRGMIGLAQPSPFRMGHDKALCGSLGTIENED